MSKDVSATSLSDQIAEFTLGMAKQAPPEIAAKLAVELEKLAASGIGRRALAKNAKAPDFSLPDTQGRPITLSSLLAKGPVVLTFYRGGWCPFCDLQLRAYQRILPSIRDLGAELVAISPQTADYARSDVERKQLTFPVLHDAGNRVARTYGLVYALSDALKELQIGFGNPIPKFNGDDSWELPMPGTFVLDRDGVVKLAHVDPNYAVRLELAAILDVLRELHRTDGASPQKAPVASVKQQAEAKLQQAYRDMGDGKLEELMTLFADDVVLHNPGQPALVGAAALRAFWSRTLSAFATRLVPHVDEADAFGDAIVLRGTITGVMVSRANGAETPVDSWFLQVYRKQRDGSLRFWRGSNGPNPASR